MINNLFIFVVALSLVIKGATLSTRYSEKLAQSFRLSRYTVGFIVIAVISILPETFISVNSALAGIPSFGLGMLLGSNIADLTLIFALIVFLSGRSLKAENKILKNRLAYPFILMFPLVLGLNGHLSRLEGLALILAGGIFYYLALKEDVSESIHKTEAKDRTKNVCLLVFFLAILLTGSHFTVNSAVAIANNIGINPILIGMLIVGIGTTMPEFFFSLNSVKKGNDSMAIGDILGTVLADATIVIGILALVNPFYFPKKIIYITGLFMVIAATIFFKFIKSGKRLTKKEAFLLFVFWVIFATTEFFINYRFPN